MTKYLSVIILHACIQMQHVRSYAAVYHLIQGKKSIQTLQDAKLFDLGTILGIYKRLSIRDFKQELRLLQQYSLIEDDAYHEKMIHVTDLGKKWLEEADGKYIISRFHGLDLSGKDDVFMRRLMLLIQTLANTQKGNMSFIPVADSKVISSWVRSFYYKHTGGQRQLLSNIYTDMLIALSGLSERDCALFVDHLTGFNHYGLSTAQLAEKYHLNSHDVVLLLLSVCHHMIHHISTAKQNFTVLQHILGARQTKQTSITSTANKTYDLYQNGVQLEDIARLRRLKINTIYDHIVEIALYNPHFNIDPFVPKDLQHAIATVVQNNPSFRLSKIKEQVAKEVSYFQIRLVLANIKQ